MATATTRAPRSEAWATAVAAPTRRGGPGRHGVLRRSGGPRPADAACRRAAARRGQRTPGHSSRIRVPAPGAERHLCPTADRGHPAVDRLAQPVPVGRDGGRVEAGPVVGDLHHDAVAVPGQPQRRAARPARAGPRWTAPRRRSRRAPRRPPPAPRTAPATRRPAARAAGPSTARSRSSSAHRAGRRAPTGRRPGRRGYAGPPRTARAARSTGRTPRRAPPWSAWRGRCRAGRGSAAARPPGRPGRPPPRGPAAGSRRRPGRRARSGGASPRSSSPCSRSAPAASPRAPAPRPGCRPGGAGRVRGGDQQPGRDDQRAGAVACALITVVLASTAIQLPSPGSTSGATSHGMSRQAAVVSATSPATSGPVIPWRSARTAYQTDQAVSAATAGHQHGRPDRRGAHRQRDHRADQAAGEPEQRRQRGEDRG